MEYIERMERYPKELFELGDGLGKFSLAVKKALEDGWQMGEDLPTILTAAMTTLIPAVQGMEKFGDEVGEDLEGSVKALVATLLPAIFQMIKKTETKPV